MRDALDLLRAAAGTTAVRPLAKAVTDPHLDLRKAAVIPLGRWAADPYAVALRRALDDGDADVRGYARRALRIQS